MWSSFVPLFTQPYCAMFRLVSHQPCVERPAQTVTHGFVLADDQQLSSVDSLGVSRRSFILNATDEMNTANESHWQSVIIRASVSETLRRPTAGWLEWPRGSAKQKKLLFLLRSSMRVPRTSRWGGSGGGGGGYRVGRTGHKHVRTNAGRKRNCDR